VDPFWEREEKKRREESEEGKKKKRRTGSPCVPSVIITSPDAEERGEEKRNGRHKEKKGKGVASRPFLPADDKKGKKKKKKWEKEKKDKRSTRPRPLSLSFLPSFDTSNWKGKIKKKGEGNMFRKGRKGFRRKSDVCLYFLPLGWSGRRKKKGDTDTGKKRRESSRLSHYLPFGRDKRIGEKKKRSKRETRRRESRGRKRPPSLPYWFPA